MLLWPAHIVVGFALEVTVGSGFTATETVPVLLHPDVTPVTV
jgi:hypothetical protein